MAKFSAELPLELIKEFEKLSNNSEKMVGEMVQAGADTVFKNVKTNIKKSFKDTERLEEHLYMTKVYNTPSDDGINVKIKMDGYLDKEKKKPVPLIANARERGTSHGEKAKPFFRKSFKNNEIEQAMLKVQDKYLPKD